MYDLSQKCFILVSINYYTSGSRVHLEFISNRRCKVRYTIATNWWNFASGKVRDWRAFHSIKRHCTPSILSCSPKSVKFFNVFWNHFRTLHEGCTEIAKQIPYSFTQIQKLRQNHFCICIQQLNESWNLQIAITW